MKARILGVVLLVLVCWGTAHSQFGGPLLPKTVTGVNASSNVTVNATLDPAFLLKGTISGAPASTPDSILAASTTSSASFSGTIDPSTNAYRIELPVGTYKLNVTFTNNGASFSYTDSTSPSPFTISGDTIRNITLPSVTTSAITGTVSNLNAQFSQSRGLTFDSTSISGFTDVNASAPLDASGNFTVNLPTSTFNVQLVQSAFTLVPPSSFSSGSLQTNLGSVTVMNPLALTAPTITTATLSGTATIMGSSIPANADLSAADTTTPAPGTTSSGSSSLSSTGAYSFTLGTNDTYALSLFLPVQILPPPAPKASFLPQVAVPGTLTGNQTFNPSYPTPPGTVTGVTVSGRVTITGTNTPVAKATIGIFGNQINNAPSTYFSQSTTADAFGNYSVVVPAGTNYTLSVSGTFFTSGDLDGDGKADFSIFRPSNGTWFLNLTDPNVVVQQWGTFGDIPVRGDFDGDGRTDIAVFRPSTGEWFVIPSSNPGTPIVQQWGTNNDIPVPGDYDGDGKTDFAVWRPSTGEWFIIPSSNPGAPIVQRWGTNNDIPVPGDYDGDGKTDFAVWRPSTGEWFIVPTSNPGSPIVQQWGTSGDMPVPGDYDGDGKTDFAVFRPSTGTWYIIPTSNPGSPVVQQWGTTGDIPVPVDYDRDRKTDIAVWRPSNGTWYVIPSSAPGTFAVTQWGTSGDVPTQKPIGQ